MVNASPPPRKKVIYILSVFGYNKLEIFMRKGRFYADILEKTGQYYLF